MKRFETRFKILFDYICAQTNSICPMNQLEELLSQCCESFSQTAEYSILKNYRTRESRFSFDDRLAIAKCVEHTFAPIFDLLKSDAPNLKDTDLLYIALCTLQFDTVVVAECISVSQDTVRVRKYRMREKLPSKWFELFYHEKQEPTPKCNANETFHSLEPAAGEISLPRQLTKNTTIMKQKLSFGKAVATCFSKYFTTQGRARRSEYWYFFLFCFLINLTFYIAGKIMDGTVYPTLNDQAEYVSRIIMRTIDWIVFLLLIIPTYTVTVRRLHDRDDNGWLAIFLCLIPSAIITAIKVFVHLNGDDILIKAEESAEYAWNFVIPFFVLALFQLGIFITEIALFSKPGTEGPNDFGADPIHLLK